jgi:group I intron endonuclease
MKKDSFVYCWTNHKTKKLYVGVHKGHIDDGYICSSKIMLEEYSLHPQDFTRQIIAEGPYQDMLSLETAILRSVNAKLNEDYYNLHNGDGKFYNKSQTEEAKRKISQSKIGKPRSEETKRKLSLHKHSEETKQKLRELRLKQSDPRLGKTHSEESKDKMRKASLGNKGHNKKVTIDGITYESYKVAADVIGCNYNTITKRVKRGIYV